MNKLSYSDALSARLHRLARPYYLDDGPNSWQHIQEVRRRAQKMNRKLEGRGLNPAELAAVLFHDSTKHDMGGKDHGRTGAQRASAVLLAAGALPKQQIDEAVQAISLHDDNMPKFPSRTAELLASADANPPDIDWFLNKAWCHNINKGHRPDESYAYIVNGPAKGKYGMGGNFNWPGIYKDYYGEDSVDKFRKQIDDMTEDEAKARLSAYHEKYDIDPEHPHVIHNR